MKAWQPWDPNNPWAGDLDDDPEEPVEASVDPCEERLTIQQIVVLADGLVTTWRIEVAIKDKIFPNACKTKGQKCRVWTIPRSEAEAWLERLTNLPGGRPMDQRSKKQMAVHEAGHCVAIVARGHKLIKSTLAASPYVGPFDEVVFLCGNVAERLWTAANGQPMPPVEACDQRVEVTDALVARCETLLLCNWGLVEEIAGQLLTFGVYRLNG